MNTSKTINLRLSEINRSSIADNGKRHTVAIRSNFAHLVEVETKTILMSVEVTDTVSKAVAQLMNDADSMGQSSAMTSASRDRVYCQGANNDNLRIS